MTNARLAVNLGIFAAIVGGLVWLGAKDQTPPKAEQPKRSRKRSRKA